MLVVRELREALGMSRSQFAQLLGCSVETIEKYEVTVPSERLRQLAGIAAERELPGLAAEFRAAEAGETPREAVAGRSPAGNQLIAEVAAAVEDPVVRRLFRAMLDALAQARGRPSLRRRPRPSPSGKQT